MKIISAAILYKGAVFSEPPPSRHHNIIAVIRRACLLSVPVSGEVQGFLTDEGAFVDRVKAGKIAIAAGQLAELSEPPDLYSEDLW